MYDHNPIATYRSKRQARAVFIAAHDTSSMPMAPYALLVIGFTIGAASILALIAFM